MKSPTTGQYPHRPVASLRLGFAAVDEIREGLGVVSHLVEQISHEVGPRVPRRQVAVTDQLGDAFVNVINQITVESHRHRLFLSHAHGYVTPRNEDSVHDRKNYYTTLLTVAHEPTDSLRRRLSLFGDAGPRPNAARKGGFTESSMSDGTPAGRESRTRPDASTRLNSDDRERLQTLDGVGPVTADRLAQEFGTVGEIVRTALRAHDGPAWQCVDRGDALARFEAVDGVGHARADRLVETIVEEWTDVGEALRADRERGRLVTDGGDDTVDGVVPERYDGLVLRTPLANGEIGDDEHYEITRASSAVFVEFDGDGDGVDRYAYPFEDLLLTAWRVHNSDDDRADGGDDDPEVRADSGRNRFEEMDDDELRVEHDRLKLKVKGALRDERSDAPVPLGDSRGTLDEFRGLLNDLSRVSEVIDDRARRRDRDDDDPEIVTDGGSRRTTIVGERRSDVYGEQRRRVHRALGELLDADHGPHREVTVTARQVASRDERLDSSTAGRWLSTLCGENPRLDDEEASAVFDVNLWSGCRSRRKWTVSQRLPDGSVDAFVGSDDREERERAQSTVRVSPPDRQNVTVTAEQALMTVVCERCRSRYAAARSECPNCRDSPEVVTDGGRPSCVDCGGQPDGLDAPTRETLCRPCARQRADTRAAQVVTDGGRPEPDWREDGLCNLCRDRTARTLTGDSHPQGPNIVVCEACAYDAPEMSVSSEAVDRLREYCWFRSGNPVLGMVFDAYDRTDLDWKDWERVVRHSRGTLAVRVDVGLGHDRYVGVSRHGPVVVRHDRETEIDDAQAASHYLKLVTDSDATTLWPVCAEHTPVVQRCSWSDASWHEIASDPETWAAFESFGGESA